MKVLKMCIKRLWFIISLIFCFYSLEYLISNIYQPHQSILNGRTNRFRNTKVQLAVFDLKSNKADIEFSGEYEELPSKEAVNSPHQKYKIENIYFLLTTNTDRIRYTINFLKFWSKSPRINCLIIFEENDYSGKKSIQYLLENNQIPCQIKQSNIQRYEERFFQLLDFAENLIKSENKTIEWIAIADDDTLWFTDNLLRTLGQYNSSKLIYLGNISDRNATVKRHGTYYAYGGAGILLSKPLVLLASNYSQSCGKKFRHMFGGDEMIGKCFTEVLGINLTQNEHFHQLDHEGDVQGFFQSGIEGLVTLHHMFILWEPFPAEHAAEEVDILNIIEAAYRRLNMQFLKRFFRINEEKNQTLLLTNGYSFTVFNRIITREELNQLELTWTGSHFSQRMTRAKEKNKIDFFFKQFNHPSRNSAIYQFRTKQIELILDN